MAVSEVVAKHPIGSGLDDFRDALIVACNEIGICDYTDLRAKVALLEAFPGMVNLTSICLSC